MYSSRHSASSSFVLMLTMSPTWPRSTPSASGGFFLTMISPASLPHRPMALPPRRPICEAMFLFSLPASTICTISIVASSVMRRPLWNVLCTPTRPSMALISGPPPCTRIGLMPTYLSSVTSSRIFCVSSSFFIALPPYLMTTVLPHRRWIYGSASMRMFALLMKPMSIGSTLTGLAMNLPSFCTVFKNEYVLRIIPQDTVNMQDI